MATLVKDIMQESVITLSPDIKLDVLEQEFCHFNVAAVPVLEKGKVIGVVSRSDIISQLSVRDSYMATAMSQEDGGHVNMDSSRETHGERYVEGIEHWMDHLTVRDIMCESVHSVTPEQSLAEAAKLMIEENNHRLLVMEQGELVGIVSSMDFVRHHLVKETSPV